MAEPAEHFLCSKLGSFVEHAKKEAGSDFFKDWGHFGEREKC